MAEKLQLKMARALPAQIESMRQWLQKLEELMDDDGNGPFEIGAYVMKTFEQNRIDEYERILFGYETLVENACDQSKSYLDWKPDIKVLISPTEQLGDV